MAGGEQIKKDRIGILADPVFSFELWISS